MACGTYMSLLDNYHDMPESLTFSAPRKNEVAVASTRGQSNIAVFVRSAVRDQPRASVLLWTAEEGMASTRVLSQSSMIESPLRHTGPLNPQSQSLRVWRW